MYYCIIVKSISEVHRSSLSRKNKRKPSRLVTARPFSSNQLQAVQASTQGRSADVKPRRQAKKGWGLAGDQVFPCTATQAPLGKGLRGC